MLKIIFILSALLIGEPAIAAESSWVSDLQHVMSDSSNTGKILQLFIIFTIISVAPSILIMVTSFVRISIVFSFLRTALGLQQTPPNQVLISLSVFLTLFIMSPVIEQSYENGVKPWMDEKIVEADALPKIIAPFKKFMTSNTRPKDLDLFIGISKIDSKTEISELPFHIVTPAFMISELRRAFEIGFLVFLPFIIIDILVASLLMAMGMMMMPPVMVALPFKVIFFVLIDGWYILAGSLVKSFVL